MANKWYTMLKTTKINTIKQPFKKHRNEKTFKPYFRTASIFLLG